MTIALVLLTAVVLLGLTALHQALDRIARALERLLVIAERGLLRLTPPEVTVKTTPQKTPPADVKAVAWPACDAGWDGRRN